jgi:hypothetical protein
MRKKILAAAIRSNETETLRVVEPLDGTCSHKFTFLIKIEKWAVCPSADTSRGEIKEI